MNTENATSAQAGLQKLLNGIPADVEKERLRAVISDCEKRHLAIDRSIPAAPDDVGDGSETDVLVLLELRVASPDAVVSDKAKAAISSMKVRMATLARVADEERAISLTYSPAHHRLQKISRMERGMRG